MGGTVAELHGRELPLERRSVWVMAPTTATLVLGSAQGDDLVDRGAAAAAGWDVARRRSGGGLVALDPPEVVWVDVVVPRGDPLWSEDVGEAFGWLGDAWGRALASMGIAAVVHHGATEAPAEGRVVCFAGVGRGELTVDGAKLVGLSQRRTRVGARFQCLLHRRWRPERWWPLVTAPDDGPLRRSMEQRVRRDVVSLADLGHADPAAADLVVAGFVSELLQLG